MNGFLEASATPDSRRFLLAVRRLADSLNYGTDPSPFRGAGIEYAQSRGLRPEDSVRWIDWRVTARTGRHHVKEFEVPRQMPCYLLLDTSASMTVSSIPLSKYALAVRLAGALAFACLDRVSPVGLLGVGSSRIHYPVSLSRPRVLLWLERLRTFRYDEETRLAVRVRELAPRLKTRSLLILLSDLHDPEAVDSLQALAQRHEVVVLQIRDPAETQVRRAGFLRAREAETGRAFLLQGRTALSDPAQAARALRRGGIDHLLIETDRPFVHRVRHFLQFRHRLGKGAR